MRIALIMALCCLGLMSTGCLMAGMYSTPVVPPHGYLYAQMSAPLTPDLNNTKVSTKFGTATMVSYLGMVAMGDCSIQAAAKQGGITTIHYADYTLYNIAGAYSKFTITVYGD